ncbi:hypothetical protein CEXT_331491 [Caerostris extrusa]|uniref:Uncharacterized protein n=1 Tax=Caerostris extrusa TaxID=172846 RepID=A0AAV4NMR2_CAEEX|nr:hypothetical protein CEXT_331491 [Caerostris extrusa]
MYCKAVEKGQAKPLETDSDMSSFLSIHHSSLSQRHPFDPLIDMETNFPPNQRSSKQGKHIKTSNSISVSAFFLFFSNLNDIDLQKCLTLKKNDVWLIWQRTDS